MAYIELSREQDMIVMEIMKKLNSPLSMPAVMIMLEDGMCTQEVKLREYVFAKNAAQALLAPDNEKDYYLAQNLTEEDTKRLSDIFYEVVRETELERE